MTYCPVGLMSLMYHILRRWLLIWGSVVGVVIFTISPKFSEFRDVIARHLCNRVNCNTPSFHDNLWYFTILGKTHKKAERWTGLSELFEERQTKRILCLQTWWVFSYNCNTDIKSQLWAVIWPWRMGLIMNVR